jgi:ABC-type nitrate/sulfonate/bicarbonate transport system substrate-binding protein
MIRKSRWVATAAFTGAVAITLVGCSSSAPAPNSSPGGSAPKDVVSLSVGTAAPVMDFADVYVAEQKGYFKQAGVNVDIHSGVGASGLNSIVAGQLDLLMFGTGQALIPAGKGIDMKIVYNQMGAGDSGAVAVAASSPYKKLTDLSGKSVGVLGVGGSSFGWGEYYSSYSAKHGGSAWNVTQSPSTTDQVNGVIAGHYAALVSTGSLLEGQLASNQLRLLVDPSAAAGQKYVPAQYAETVTFGIGKTLQAKKTAVTRFVAGMRAADAWLQTADPSDIANVIKGDSAWDGQSIESMTLGAEYEKKFFAPSLGQINPALWSATLKQLGYWGLPEVNLSDKTYSYGQRVDMSYLKAAKSIKINAGK